MLTTSSRTGVERPRIQQPLTSPPARPQGESGRRAIATGEISVSARMAAKHNNPQINVTIGLGLEPRVQHGPGRRGPHRRGPGRTGPGRRRGPGRNRRPIPRYPRPVPRYPGRTLPRYPWPIPIPIPIPIPVPRNPGSRDVHRLIAQLRRAPWDSERLRILRFDARFNYFTPSQAAEALRTFDWDSSRLDGLRLIAPQIFGRAGRWMIVDTFDFLSSRREAERILDRYGR